MIIQSARARLHGSVSIPSSKSHTVRALVFGLLGSGVSTIRNPLDSGDTRAALATVQALGAEVEVGKAWTIRGVDGRIEPPENVIDVGNSGTTLYIAMSIAALASGHTVFTGDAQIRRRPAGKLLAALRDLGATAFSSRGNGCAPLVIGGALRGGTSTIECPTSQYLTSLLIALPLAEQGSTIHVPLLHEQPYVHMTLKWLDSLGIELKAEPDLSRFDLPGGQRYPNFDRTMAGDFSSATFFLCAAALTGGDVLLEGLDLNDAQGDKAVLDYLEAMGATIAPEAEGLRVTADGLTGTELDLNATPDALPAMAVTACFARGETRLVNVPQARLKETDRIAVMATELKALGADVEELDDGLVIRESQLRGMRVHGHDDHRVVMALSLAGLVTDEPVEVDSAKAVAVTFPDFPERMAALGAHMAVIDD